MAEQSHRVVSGADSDLHDEPHIAGSRITVRFLHERVEGAGLAPAAVADRHNLDVADVYEALAYYHRHPEEMSRVEAAREEAIETARTDAATGPDDLE